MLLLGDINRPGPMQQLCSWKQSDQWRKTQQCNVPYNFSREGTLSIVSEVLLHIWFMLQLLIHHFALSFHLFFPFSSLWFFSLPQISVYHMAMQILATLYFFWLSFIIDFTLLFQRNRDEELRRMNCELTLSCFQSRRVAQCSVWGGTEGQGQLMQRPVLLLCLPPSISFSLAIPGLLIDQVSSHSDNTVQRWYVPTARGSNANLCVSCGQCVLQRTVKHHWFNPLVKIQSRVWPFS